MNEGLEFYRCTLCTRVVSVWDIRQHNGCRHCGSGKIQPTNLTIFEKLVQIVRHPAIWKWKGAGI